MSIPDCRLPLVSASLTLGLIGARRRDQLTEALGALERELQAEILTQVERAVPRGAAAGERYNPPGMALLDSERGSSYEGFSHTKSLPLAAIG